MPASLLDGKTLSEQLCQETAARCAAFRAESGVTPTLAAVLVGDDPASQIYVRNKQKACEKAGLTSQLFRLPQTTSTDELL
ncbi:MAG: tetrahydrofolate dehydrogenase/cyclohydrolase catalytic domain-containing protein, partial [Planctomycetota bacterium]